jgi:YesN/AraC family two-component response regulator
MKSIHHVKSISEIHQLFELAKPKHPLVSVFRHADLVVPDSFIEQSFTTDLYMIGLKERQEAVVNYGRETYDFQEGTITFLSPNQVFSFNSADFTKCKEEWTLVFHPDFISKTNLGNEIDNCHFFSYETNEALHVSEDEKLALNDLILKIEKEYYQQIDKHTQEIICVNIETVLKYCQRFYARQFITRKLSNNRHLAKFESYLKKHFSQTLIEKGLPTVKQCGEALNLSPHYLSDLLKEETGKNAKEHIDLFVIKKAKVQLQNQEFSISQVAFEMGFGYPNHFSKFFKSKTGLSPSEFRNLSVSEN